MAGPPEKMSIKHRRKIFEIAEIETRGKPPPRPRPSFLPASGQYNTGPSSKLDKIQKVTTGIRFDTQIYVIIILKSNSLH